MTHLNNQRNSRRDSKIEALHAAVLSLGAVIDKEDRPGTTWVFASQTTKGAWIFVYKTQEDSPGEGWKKISSILIEHVSGGEGYIRVDP